MFPFRPLVIALLLPIGAFAAERELRLVEPRVAARHVLLTPAAPLTDADRDALAAEGIHVGRAVTGGRFTARVESGANVDDARIASLAALTPAQKIHSSAWRVAAQGKPFAHVRVFFHEDVTLAEAARVIADAGGATDDPMPLAFEPLSTVMARIAPSSLTTLASDDRVLLVYGERPFRATAFNATAAALSHVDQVQAAPYSLSGDGVVLTYFELGAADPNNAEFQGRLTVEFTCGSASSDPDCTDKTNTYHATHVAGTMIAAGLQAAAKGMAPKATLHEFRGNSGSWLSRKQNTLASLGSVADNNSWGFILGWVNAGTASWSWVEDSEELIGGYSADLNAPLDRIAFVNGTLMMHAAGNEASITGPTDAPFRHNHWGDSEQPAPEVYCYSANGSGTDCPTPQCTAGTKYCETVHHPAHNATSTNPGGSVNWLASGKNILTVGATMDTREVSSFSSRGPTKDGRVKPDITAKGGPTPLYSTFPNSACLAPPCYGREQGTSMASPVVTGSTALLVEQWRKLHSGASPSPLILKAILLGGADDIGNPGPDYTYGFGFLNVKASTDMIIADNGEGKRVKFDDASAQTTFDYPITLSGAQDLRVLLTWFDPEILPIEGQESSVKTLVNDLDIKVVAPGGGETLPYVLDAGNPGSNATRGNNTVDNVEEVEIKGAAAGTYHVMVSHKASLTTSTTEVAKFAVVSNADFGAAALPCTDATEPNDASAYAVPNGVSITAAACSSSDVDLFSFTSTASGAIAVRITATQTPLRATLSNASGVQSQITIAAGSTGTLTATAPSGSTQYTVRIEPDGAIGTAAAYTVTASYPFAAGPHRRAVRH